MRQYAEFGDRPYRSHYLFLDRTFDCAIDKLWPRVLKIGEWMDAHALETISGAPGSVGHFERVHPRGVDNATPRPHYHLYGVSHIVAPRFIALEVFPERGGSYGDAKPHMSFDTITLTDLGARTNLVFAMIDVRLAADDVEAPAKQTRDHDAGLALLDRYFDNLARLVGDGG